MLRALVRSPALELGSAAGTTRCMRKDDPAFKKLVDGVLAAQMKSGEFERLHKKRLLSPIPPKGINLNTPMGEEPADRLKALSDKPAL